MDEAILEIVVNGTNAAARAGEISPVDAEHLNKEALEAASLEPTEEIDE